MPLLAPVTRATCRCLFMVSMPDYLGARSGVDLGGFGEIRVAKNAQAEAPGAAYAEPHGDPYRCAGRLSTWLARRAPGERRTAHRDEGALRRRARRERSLR